MSSWTSREDLKKELRENVRNSSRRRSAFGAGALEGATLGSYPKIEAGVRAAIHKLNGNNRSFNDIYEEEKPHARRRHQEKIDGSRGAALAGELLSGAVLPILRPFQAAKQSSKIANLAATGGLYGALGSMGHRDNGNIVDGGDLAGGIYGSAAGAALGSLGRPIARFFKKEIPVPEKIQELVNINKKRKTQLKAGEITGDPSLLKDEYNASIGRYGKSDQEFSKNLAESNYDLYKKDVEDVLKKVGGRNEKKDGSLYHGVVSILSKAENERKGISNLYESAVNNVGGIPAERLKDMGKILHRKFEKTTLSEHNAPKTFSEIGALQNYINNSISATKPIVSLNKLESWRQSINKTIPRADPQEQRGLKLMLKEYDRVLNNRIKSTVAGDKNSLKMFERARSAQHQWFNRYKPAHKSDKSKTFIWNMIDQDRFGGQPITPEEVITQLMGSGTGPVSANKAATLMKLKKDFPELAPSIKNELVNRVGETLSAPGLRIDSHISNLDKVLKKNNSLMKDFLTKTDLDEIHDLGKLGRAAFTRVKSPENPSGSAGAYFDPLRNKVKSFTHRFTSGISDHVDQEFIEKAIKSKMPRESTPASNLIEEDVVPTWGKAHAIRASQEEYNTPEEQDSSSIDEIDKRINELESQLSPNQSDHNLMEINELDAKIKHLESLL